MKYVCLNCEAKFEEPRTIRTTQATLFGLPRLHDPYIEVSVCPYCSCEDFETEESEGNEDE